MFPVESVFKRNEENLSVKKKIYWLTILLVSLTIIITFIFNIYYTWQKTLDDRYKETTAVANLLDQSLQGSFDDYILDSSISKEEKISQLNTKLQPFVDDIIISFENFGTGYYVKNLQSIVAFGPNFSQDGLIDIKLSSDARIVYETKKPLKFYNYSQTRDGYVVATILPIIRDGEVIGHTWSNVLLDDLFTYFQKDILAMFGILFLMLLIALVGSSMITNQYIKQLKDFRGLLRQSKVSKKSLRKFPQELIEIYTEVTTSREMIMESEKRFRDVVTAFDEFVWETDLDGNYTYLSDRVKSILGYSAKELIGKSTFAHMEAPNNEIIAHYYKEAIEKKITFRNIHFAKKNAMGDIIYLSCNGVPIFNEDNHLIGYRGATRDVSLEKKHEKEIHLLAYYDQITMLPNRTMLMKQIQLLIDKNKPFALLFLDLDQFKSINDSINHTAGDTLLKITASRLKEQLVENDQIFRFGGDEFIITLTNFKTTEELTPRIQSIIDTLGMPVKIKNIHLFNTGSIGISVYPQHGTTAEVLIKNADMAMFKSKANGRNQVTFYSIGFENEITESFALANDLKEALGTNQFVLNYQPQIDLTTGEIIGAEALIRWYHPSKGFISPEKFIRIAEEHGHIIELGNWILNQACADRKKWLNAGLDKFRVAVNISIKQFEQPNFVEQVLAILRQSELSSQYVELEITEGVAMAEPEIVIEKLQQLKDHNLYISIDDFGMGYSSLNYLKRLPIHQLKIDRSFVMDIEQKNDFAIVQSIITMAHSLDLNVVAEGVETEQQATILRSLECGIAQGYHYFKPMPEVDLVEILHQNKVLHVN